MVGFQVVADEAWRVICEDCPAQSPLLSGITADIEAQNWAHDHKRICPMDEPLGGSRPTPSR
jgi:hypothetical protein